MLEVDLFPHIRDIPKASADPPVIIRTNCSVVDCNSRILLLVRVSGAAVLNLGCLHICPAADVQTQDRQSGPPFLGQDFIGDLFVPWPACYTAFVLPFAYQVSVFLRRDPAIRLHTPRMAAKPVVRCDLEYGVQKKKAQLDY